MATDTQVIPFGRGRTAYQGTTIDTNNLMHADWEGMVRIFPETYGPNDPTSPNSLARRSEGSVKAICVRNTSGATLYPGTVVTWASGYRGKRVDGRARVGISSTLAEPAGIVDDHLPATGGVPTNDLFWLIVGGNCLIKTPMGPTDLASDTTSNWADGNILVALTAAASTVAGTTATAGRAQIWVAPFTATQTTDGTALRVLSNRIGRVVTARTTANTDTFTLIHAECGSRI